MPPEDDDKVADEVAAVHGMIEEEATHFADSD